MDDFEERLEDAKVNRNMVRLEKIRSASTAFILLINLLISQDCRISSIGQCGHGGP